MKAKLLKKMRRRTCKRYRITERNGVYRCQTKIFGSWITSWKFDNLKDAENHLRKHLVSDAKFYLQRRGIETHKRVIKNKCCNNGRV